MARDRMQFECTVRLATMQIHRDADDRDVRSRSRAKQDLPPREMQHPVGEKIKQGIQQGSYP
jgi:hypothetical protein